MVQWLWNEQDQKVLRFDSPQQLPVEMLIECCLCFHGSDKYIVPGGWQKSGCNRLHTSMKLV